MGEFDRINGRGLVLVGCGRMGGAMLRGWLARGLEPGAVTVIDPRLAPEWQDKGLRVNAPLPDDPVVHRALLAYASDHGLLGAALLPHGLSYAQPRLRLASLDHAMWFHRDFRLDDWLLYTMDSPSAGGGRGLSRGSMFTRDGRLVASMAQEGMVRVRS